MTASTILLHSSMPQPSHISTSNVQTFLKSFDTCLAELDSTTGPTLENDKISCLESDHQRQTVEKHLMQQFDFSDFTVLPVENIQVEFPDLFSRPTCPKPPSRRPSLLDPVGSSPHNSSVSAVKRRGSLGLDLTFSELKLDVQNFENHFEHVGAIRGRSKTRNGSPGSPARRLELKAPMARRPILMKFSQL